MLPIPIPVSDFSPQTGLRDAAAAGPDPGSDPGPASGGGLRARKKLLVRAAIVDAALDLFAERGYDTTTVPEIAARAGVSPATVARYFPAKDALLFPERGVRVPALRAAVIARPADEPPLRAVLGAVAQQPPMGAESLRRLALQRRAIASSAVLRGRALGLLGQWRDGIAEAVAEREGLSRESAHVLATAVVAVLDDVTERWAAEGAADGLQERALAALAVLAGAAGDMNTGSSKGDSRARE
ncbi:TetR/AcrR family transcriptional regulator [Streptodolium elevatio]